MRSYALSACKGEYQVLLLEIPAFHQGVTALAYHVCNLTRQRFCHLLCGKTGTWEMNAEKIVGKVNITADQLKELDRDFWSIFEEDDDE